MHMLGFMWSEFCWVVVPRMKSRELQFRKAFFPIMLCEEWFCVLFPFSPFFSFSSLNLSPIEKQSCLPSSKINFILIKWKVKICSVLQVAKPCFHLRETLFRKINCCKCSNKMSSRNSKKDVVLSLSYKFGEFDRNLLKLLLLHSASVCQL